MDVKYQKHKKLYTVMVKILFKLNLLYPSPVDWLIKRNPVFKLIRIVTGHMVYQTKPCHYGDICNKKKYILGQFIH